MGAALRLQGPLQGEEGGQKVGRGYRCLDGAGPDGHLCWEGRPETRWALVAKGCGEAVSPGGGLVWGSGPSRQTNPGQRKGKEALGEAGTCGQLYQLLTAVEDAGGRSQGSGQEAEWAAWQSPISRRAPLPPAQQGQGGRVVLTHPCPGLCLPVASEVGLQEGSCPWPWSLGNASVGRVGCQDQALGIPGPPARPVGLTLWARTTGPPLRPDYSPRGTRR